MSTRTLTILFGVFLALLAVVLLQFAAPTLFTPKQTDYEKAIQAVRPDTIQTITVQKNNQSVKLIKKEERWIVNDKKASQEKLDDLLSQLIRQPKATVVAQTNARHTDLEVTDSLATAIALDNTITFLAGKSAGDGVYIRIKGTDPVYLLSSLSPTAISPTVQDWYDKTITTLDEKTINTLTFVKPTEQFTLTQENGTWKFAEGNTPVEPTALTSLLADLASFQAQSIADEATAAVYPPTPELALTIEKKEGKEVLNFFMGTDDYLVKRSSDTQHFIIPTFQAKHFLFSSTEIRTTDPTPTPNPS